MKKKALRIIFYGGYGDALLYTPAFKALKEEAPDRKIIVYCVIKGQEQVFKNNPSVDEVRGVSFIKNPIAFIGYYLKWMPFLFCHYGEYCPTLFYNKNAKEIIADLYGVKLKDDKVQFFLTRKEDRTAKEYMAQYKDPILIHVTSRASPNQHWEHDNWNRLVEEMPEYTFLQLGLEDEKKIEKAVDLRGQLSFRETLGILKYSKSFVGVNSSFAHATNSFGLPGVVIFGPAQPDIWGQPNNINIFKSVRCSPCLEILRGSPCPYNRLCMKQITVAEVKEALLKQLKTRSLSLS